MQPCPRQNKESRHRQPAHSLRIAAKAQKEVAQLGKTYAIQIEDQSIHPLGVLQPVLLSAICKTAAQSKAVPLDKLHVILFPCVVIHLPAPELLILALFVPIQIHSVRMGKIRVPFSGVLIVRKQLFIKLITSDLRILCAQILVAASIILGHITTSQKKKYQKENPLRGIESAATMENPMGLPHFQHPSAHPLFPLRLSPFQREKIYFGSTLT